MLWGINFWKGVYNKLIPFDIVYTNGSQRWKYFSVVPQTNTVAIFCDFMTGTNRYRLYAYINISYLGKKKKKIAKVVIDSTPDLNSYWAKIVTIQWNTHWIICLCVVTEVSSNYTHLLDATLKIFNTSLEFCCLFQNNMTWNMLT